MHGCTTSSLGQTSAGFRLGYQPTLDGLRGLAVLSVMIGHVTCIGAGVDFTKPMLGWQVPLQGAYFAVDLFFALSGFLITAMLVEEHRTTGRVSIPQFYLRRQRRLMPALAVLLSVCLVYTLLPFERGTTDFMLRAMALTICWGANFYWCIPGQGLGMLTHVWSLCVEEQFYLFWPLVLCVLLRSRLSIRGMVVILAALGVLSALFRFSSWWFGGITGYHVACVSLPARADGLIAGSLAALLLFGRAVHLERNRLRLRWATWAAAVVMAGLIIACGHGRHLFCGCYSLAGVAGAVLTLGLVAAPPPLLKALLSLAPLRWIGQISYGLYLWHVPIYCALPLMMQKLLNRSPGAKTVDVPIAFGLSIACAAASYYFVERPLRAKQKSPKVVATPHFPIPSTLKAA